MPDEVDLGLARALLQRRDRFVDLFVDFFMVTHGRRRVVVDLFDPAVRIAVAFKAHRLGGEVRARALEPVDDQDRTAFELPRVSRGHSRLHQRAGGEGAEQQTQPPAVHTSIPRMGPAHVSPLSPAARPAI